MTLDGVGAWPPISESHVEMDGAWALYEAWVKIQTGARRHRARLQLRRSRRPAICPDVLSRQLDPYYVAPLWPDCRRARRRSRPARCSTRARSPRPRWPAIAARSREAARDNPYAQLKGSATIDELLAEDRPRRRRCAGTTARRSPTALSPWCSRRATGPRELGDRPAWIRGIDHRIEAHGLGVARPHPSPSTAPRRREGGRRRRPSTSPSCTPPSPTRS